MMLSRAKTCPFLWGFFFFGSGEMYQIQHYVTKFVSDLGQVGGFLQVLRFPPPIKLTVESGVKHHNLNPNLCFIFHVVVQV